MSNTPTNGIPYVPENTTDPAAGLNLSIDVIDALLTTRVESMALSAPPGSPADGQMWVVKAPGTGAWAGHNNAFARYRAASTSWQFYEAGAQAWLCLNKADGGLYHWGGSAWAQATGLSDAPTDGTTYGRNNGAWVAVAAGGGTVDAVNGVSPDSSGDVHLDALHIPFSGSSSSGLSSTNVDAALEELAERNSRLQSLVAAASDEITALTTGTAKVTFRNPYATAFKVVHVKGSLSTAQATGSLLTVDVKEAGTTILSTKITFDNTEKTSETAATPPVVSDASIAADAEITVDITQVGDGTAKGLKVYLVGYPL